MSEHRLLQEMRAVKLASFARASISPNALHEMATSYYYYYYYWWFFRLSRAALLCLVNTLR